MRTQTMRGPRYETRDVEPIGSEGWAHDWRREMQRLLASANRPERLGTFLKLGHRWRVWALLKRRDGSHFRTLAELCAEPAPFGLGCDEGALTGEKAPKRPRRAAAAKSPRKRGKAAAAAALGLPERVKRRLKLLRRDVAEALARGELVSLAAATCAARSRRGADPVAKVLAAARRLSSVDRVRLAMRLVELGLFAKR